MNEIEKSNAAVREDILVSKINEILAEFQQFRDDVAGEKIENRKRANRFKVGMLIIGLFVGAIGAVGITSYRTADKLETFVRCQTTFNDTVNKASVIRSGFTQNYTTNTLAYGLIRNDPTSTPTQIEEARSRYYESLRLWAQAQKDNPIPIANTCRLGS